MNNLDPYPLSDISNMITIMTDIYVFVDTFWPYRWIVDYVAYVLQNLNIHPYASTVTLLNAYDGAIIVNSTNYIIDLYEKWNITSHSWYQSGFSLLRILNTISDKVIELHGAERKTGSLGGHSLIALIVPSSISYIDERDYIYCKRTVDYLNYALPELHFIYYTDGAVIRFKDFVRNPSEDLFPLNIDCLPDICGAPVVQRISQIPRRISNPRCNQNGLTDEPGVNTVIQYARLGSINFYRLDSQYFLGHVNMRHLKILPISQISFTICTSRIISLPFRNLSNPLREEESCTETTGTFNYDLTDVCSGYYFIPCAPLYFSVQPQKFGAVSCTDAACQTPDQAQYTIYVDNLSCNSCNKHILSSILLLALLLEEILFL